jgi:hypothetical protein
MAKGGLMKTFKGNRLIGFALAGLLGLSPSLSAYADEDDPPSRPVRLGFVQGTVSFEPAGTSDWVTPFINRPLTIGDQLWSDGDGRAELELDGSVLRVGPNSSVSLLNLSDTATQLQLATGTLIVHVRRLNDDESYEIDTPNLAFSALRPGTYRITVDPSGNFTTVVVRSGQGEVTGAGVAYPVYAHENDVFSGTDQLVEDRQAEPGLDEFESWGDQRDARRDRSRSARYVSPDVVGYDDLDDYGDWNQVPEYGAIWVPRNVPPGWAPYREGHWAYVAPWGYSWVDDSPWGFAPFHYGRWIAWNGRWGWVPAPPPPPGGVYVRTVYAPALVAWAAVGTGVAWFALGPREVYVPSYPVSRAYVENINVSNTVVNRTVVTNVYNTTIVNHTVINNVTYVNQRVPGAVVATSTQAFAAGQKVSSHALPVARQQLVTARAQAIAPAVVPVKQSVLGGARASARTPPPAIEHRPMVARNAPPAAPPSFEQRQAAIKANGGKPLSLSQARQLAPVARPVPVKLSPSPRLMAPPAPAQAGRNAVAPHNPPPRPAENVRSPAPSLATMPQAATPAKPTATHPNELQQQFRPASPSQANSVLERQQLQDQQRLAAQQNAERQRVQAQQEAEHRQQAQAARQNQLEQQHRQQTQQLAQHQSQERQQMAMHQESQRKQQAPEPTAHNPAPERGRSQPPDRNPH